MSRIINYRHDRLYGYCQIQLDNGERVLLSEASDYIKIFKMLFGFVPVKVLWKWHRNNDPKDVVLKIINKYPEKNFFDSFVSEILEFSSTQEISKGFGK